MVVRNSGGSQETIGYQPNPDKCDIGKLQQPTGIPSNSSFLLNPSDTEALSQTMQVVCMQQDKRILRFLLCVDRIATQASDDKGFNENRAAGGTTGFAAIRDEVSDRPRGFLPEQSIVARATIAVSHSSAQINSRFATA